MKKLTKELFNGRYRFREPREEGLVTCVTCDNMSGGTTAEEGPAYCEHPERFRRIKIAEYWENFWGGKGESHNIASKRVCDDYKSKPLPEGVVVPELPRKHAILLESQWRDPYHGDPNCPYVIEELRAMHEDRKVRGRIGVDIVDNRDMVKGDTIRDICEMPCCESKLPYQITRNPNGYRRRVGLKPDGSEPKVWVRNGIVKHEKKVEMTIEEAEEFFDLTQVVADKKGIHSKISAVSDYIRKNANLLGSRPLSKSVNPIHLKYVIFDLFDQSSVGKNSVADVWVYDKRLFDVKKGLLRPIGELEKIPEGIIPCMDTKEVFRKVERVIFPSIMSERYFISGIIKPLEDEVLLEKGLSHFIDIREVSYSAYEHWWGESGIGFSGLASFHEQ